MKYIFSIALIISAIVTKNYAQSESLDLVAIKALIADQSQANARGLEVGIVHNQEIVLEWYGGLASLEHNAAVDSKTRFNLASVAKQFTALMILDLEGKGKLDLNSDIRDYFPELFPEIKLPITLQQLLNHTSGIRDAYDLMSIQGDPWWKRPGLDNQDVFKLLTQQNSLNFNPGEAYMYSNSGYTLLALIIEQISQKPFIDFAESWFKDLGMNSTGFTDNYMAVVPNKAFPYSDWGNGIWQAYPMLTNLNGDGFLFSTLRDQLYWEQLLQSEAGLGNSVIKKSQNPIENSVASHYGYGVEHNKLYGKNSVNHSGSTGSYGARFIRFPEQNLAIVVMSNNSNIWVEGLANQIAKTLVQNPNNTEQLAYATMPEVIGNTPVLEQTLGTYKLEGDGTVIEIVRLGDDLYREIEGTDPVRLIPVRGNVYVYETIPDLKLAFVPNANGEGEYDFKLYHPTIATRLATRQPYLDLSPNLLEKANGTYYNQELDVEFSLRYSQEDMFQVSLQDDSFNATWIAPGSIQMGNYLIQANYNATGEITSFSLNYTRIQGLLFTRK